MTNLQIEHLVERWEDRRDVKNQMGKFMHYLLLKKEAAIVDDLWSTRDDICYGVNGGWYVGQAQVRDYFGWFPGYTAKVAQCLRAKFPEKFEGKNDDEIFGIGLLELKSISNYVIEVAEDGETAKGLWFCLGCNAEVTTRGPEASWTWGYFAGDFVYENDDWKIWHLQYLNDIDSLCGQSWGKEVTPYPEEDVFAPLGQFEMPPYTVAETVRPLYRVDRPLTLTPRIPEPYDTFANTFSYGKEAAR